MTATSRRGHGEGSIYRHEANGTWVGAISLGWRPDGKRIRRKVTGRTKTEVRDKLKKLHADWGGPESLRSGPSPRLPNECDRAQSPRLRCPVPGLAGSVTRWRHEAGQGVCLRHGGRERDNLAARKTAAHSTGAYAGERINPAGLKGLSLRNASGGTSADQAGLELAEDQRAERG